MPDDKGLPVNADADQKILEIRDSIQAKLDQAGREMADFNKRVLEFGELHIELMLEIMKEAKALNEQIALLYPGRKSN